MKGKISILHISDLHRSKDGEISNVALLSSLLQDKDKYSNSEDPKIKSPDIVIVSGDIIRGSSKSVGSDLEIQNQYDEAISFLTEIANYFLEGDKNRIVLIPGNHDVDWQFSKASMEKIDSATVLDDKNCLKWEVLKESINQNSTIRWSWKDLSFFKIVDSEKYDKRLVAFSNFYASFYNNERNYSLNPEDQFDIFDYPELGISIAAFNSCFNNDHLRLSGDIHPQCIAKVNMTLRELQKKGRLILSTWHHNTKGLPYDSNYMDSSKLKNFIDSGISMGFHGHQHKTELIHEYSDILEQKKVVVFSAGTLCGGPNDLPTGTNRQYNLIEIENVPEEPKLQVTLHVREKTETSSFENPIWTPGRIDSKNVSYYKLEIEKPKAPDISRELVEIEKLIAEKRFTDAKSYLARLDRGNAFVRKFIIQVCIETEDFEFAIDVFSNPETEEESIVVLNSALQLGDKAQMKNIAETIKNTKDCPRSVIELIQKIELLTK